MRDAVICTQENVLEGTERPRLTRARGLQTRISYCCIQTYSGVLESGASCHLRRPVHMPVRVAAPRPPVPVIDD